MKVGYFINLISKTKHFKEIQNTKTVKKLLTYNYNTEVSLSYLKQLKYVVMDKLKITDFNINQQFKDKGVFLAYVDGELYGSWFDERYAYINSILKVLRMYKKLQN